MALDMAALLALWTSPLPDDDQAAADRFRGLYADPVTLNGTELTAHDLVGRARAVQAAFDPWEDLEVEVVDVVDAGDKVAVAFRMGGRQVGPLGTSLGPLPPTGRRVTLRVVDLLTLIDGKVSSVWMVADELGALVALDAVGWRDD